MGETRSLQVIDSVNGTQLAPYADRDIVRELMERVMQFHPVIAKIAKQDKALATQTGLRVAQLAILMGASPIPGMNEIHVYDDGRAEAGINYWQRRGDQKGGVLWDFEARPMTRQEREMYGIDDQSLAAICRGVPLSKVNTLRGMGVSINDIVKGQGITGIGVALKSERAKNGRPPIWTAIKRAKADFFKNVFPYIPGENMTQAGAGMRQTEGGYEPDFSSPQWGNLEAQARNVMGPEEPGWWINGEEMPSHEDDAIPGEFSEVEAEPEQPAHERILERLQTAVHPNKSAPATDKQLKFVHAGLSKLFTDEKDKKAVLVAIFPECEDEEGHISSKFLSVGQASVLIDWLGALPPDFAVSDTAVNEANIILTAVREEEGQLSLFPDANDGAYSQ